VVEMQQPLRIDCKGFNLDIDAEAMVTDDVRKAYTQTVVTNGRLEIYYMVNTTVKVIQLRFYCTFGC